jgi:hypothetical protein
MLLPATLKSRLCQYVCYIISLLVINGGLKLQCYYMPRLWCSNEAADRPENKSLYSNGPLPMAVPAYTAPKQGGQMQQLHIPKTAHSTYVCVLQKSPTRLFLSPTSSANMSVKMWRLISSATRIACAGSCRLLMSASLSYGRECGDQGVWKLLESRKCQCRGAQSHPELDQSALGAPVV